MPKVVDHEKRRQELARTAFEVVETEGIHGLRLRSVAAAAGVTTGFIAHYFESKDDLIVAALEVAAEAGMRRGEERCDPSDLDGVVDLLLASAPSANQDLRGWRAWMSFWSLTISDERLAALSKSKYDEWIMLVERALRQLAARDQIADVDLGGTAAKLVAMVDGLAVQACFDHSSWPMGRQRRVIRDCVDQLVKPARAG